jgi:hypothetical protein
VITRELVDLADRVIASAPVSTDIPWLPELEEIPAVLDPDRLRARPRGRRGPLTVGYIGTVDPAKMHPDFVSLAARVRAEGVRFAVCGDGDGYARLDAEARRLGVGDRLELRGWVEDVGKALAGFDVFGYPLCRDNYSAGELVLQEAMAAGVPPVVLPYGGAARQVEDGRTGLVAADEDDYVAKLELLAADSALRAELGAAARGHALRTWSADAIARRWTAVYDELLESPKRSPRWPGPRFESGAELFVSSLGPEGGAFRESLEGGDAESDLAVRRSPAVLVRGDGGLLDFRRRFPGDPHLRLWLGLALAGQGRPALAAGELAAARRLGMDATRIERPLAELTGAPA